MNHEPHHPATYRVISTTHEPNKTEVTPQTCEAWNNDIYQPGDRYRQRLAHVLSKPPSTSLSIAQDSSSHFTQDQGRISPRPSSLTQGALSDCIFDDTFIDSDSFYSHLHPFASTDYGPLWGHERGVQQVSKPESESTHTFELEHSPDPDLAPRLEDLLKESPWNALQLRSEQTPATLDWVYTNQPPYPTLLYPTLPDSDSRTYSSNPTRDDDTLSTPQSKQKASLPATSSHSTDSTAIPCFCGAEFRGPSRRGNLARHVQQKHSAPMFQCGVSGCLKVFHRRDKLKDHVRHAHKGDVIVDDDGLLKFEHCEDAQSVGKPSLYCCTEPGCKREFRLRADLHKHQRTHLASAERPYKCPECEQSFLFPKDLRRHEGKHMGAKKMVNCPISSCSFVSSRNDNLLRHVRSAHPDRVTGKTYDE